MKNSNSLILFLLIFALTSSLAVAQLDFTRHEVYPWYAATTYPIDIDGDGDIDIFGMGYQDLSWYENNGYFGFVEHRVQDFWNYGMGSWAGDLDGDGDVDFVGSAWSGDEVAWWENDGSQNFTYHSFGLFDGAAYLFGVDLDQDGDMDIVGAADNNNLVYWLEQDSLRHFTLRTVASVLYPRQTSIIDLDRDGDLDILGQSGHHSTRLDSILWFENDGSENFTKHLVTNLGIPYDVQGADMDQDGDIDIVACSYWSDCIYWYRNTGNCTAWDTIPITLSLDGAYDIELVDLDNDGDLDIVCPCNREHFIAWFESSMVGDSLVFTQHNIPGMVLWPSEVDAIDIDFDGDWDLVAAGNEDFIWWFENHLLEPYGLTTIFTPVNAPIVVPPGGGSFQYDARIINTDPTSYRVIAYLDVVLPGGTVYPIYQTWFTVPGGFNDVRRLRQFIPGSAMPGSYYYAGHLADPRVWNIYTEDGFEVIKADGDGAPEHNQGWALYGWDFGTQAENPVDYALNPAYPNPFNPETRLSFNLPEAGEVLIAVFDVQGREVARLAEGWYSDGAHEVIFDGSNYSSGLYFARMTSGSFSQTQKLLLTK